MRFLLYTTRHGKSGSIQLDRPLVWVPVLALFAALLFGAGRLGYELGAGEPLAKARQKDDPVWALALEEQKQELAAARREAQDQLDALAVRLGEMQAEMLRVEALGQRVKKLARLKASEFDFDQPPARGGPASSAEPAAPLESRDFLKSLAEMELQIQNRKLQLEVMNQVLSRRELKNAVSPAGKPILKGWLSSYYGMRTDPFNGRREMHKGIDFAGQLGSDIVATAAGVVTWAGKRYGYGQLVEINHGNGYSTRYGHCSQILVKVGDRVEPGQKIALMGSSGRSTGPHVHYEVLKNGRQINPVRYIRQARR